LFAACVSWTRALTGPAPARVAYFEPQAAKGEAAQGAAFVTALRRARVRVRLAPNGKALQGETLVAGLFVGPRAYSGRIRLDEASRVRLLSALKAAPRAAAVSFGSPFVLAGLPARTAGLCVYSRAEAAQAAAAALFLERK
jgi:hypothetical protein